TKPVLTFADVTTPGNCPQAYDVTRTWTAKDGRANTRTASKTVHLVDTTAPVISGVGPAQTIQCPATPTFSTPTVTDACDTKPTFTFADVTTPGNCPQAYDVTRTWTAKDACGNTSTASQTVHVVDTTAPVISGVGPAQTIQCPATPTFSSPTATDACDSKPTLTFADVTTPGNCPQAYDVTRTWTAKDACGNTSTASQTVHVVDTTPPVIACPGDTTVGECHNKVTYTATATDACSGPVPVVCVPPPGTTFPVGETTVTCTATDACGNVARCTFKVTVVPNPVCSISGATSICHGETAQLCGPDGNLGYQWSTGETTRCITINGAGSYKLTVTDPSTHCSSSCTQDVVENQLPMCSITGPTEACPGSPVTLCGPLGNYGYSWTGPGGFTSPMQCISVSDAG